MKSRTIIFEDIGPVLFVHSKRAKNLNIGLRPFSQIRVAVPYRASLKNAQKVVRSKINWIKKHLTKIRQIETRQRLLQNSRTTINKVAAQQQLSNRVKKLSGKYGFRYNRVVIRNQKTRWGSCSALNNISLNINLAYLPSSLIDYVIIHELLHTQIKNHGSDFWTALGILIEDAKALNSELKKYHLGLLRTNQRV